MGAEVKNFIPETPEKVKQPEKLRPIRIDRIGGKAIIICKDPKGKQRAIVFPGNPPECFLPEEQGKISSGLQMMRDSRVARVLGILGLVAGASACADNFPDSGNTGISATKTSKQSALTVADMDHLGEPQMAAWTNFGDQMPNIGEIDSKKVVMFDRGRSLWYVDCDEFENCLSADNAKEIDNLPFIGGYSGGAIYTQIDGINKIITQQHGSAGVAEVDVFRNDEENLEAGPDISYIEPSTLSTDFTLNSNGVPKLIFTGTGVYAKLRDLHTLDEREIPLQQLFMSDCGTPDFSTSAAVASFLESEWGTEPVICKLITAPTLDELRDELLTEESFVASQNSYRPLTPRLTNPRLYGQYLIYARYDRNPVTGDMEPRIWYAVVQEYCGDAVCNGTETSGDCETDCPPTGPVCGNGECETPDETRASCATDCPPTGDDDDTGDDDTTTGDDDTDIIVEPCGDMTCDPAAGETSITCPTDCPPDTGDDDTGDDDTSEGDDDTDIIVDPCGDLTCDPAAGETSITCPTDCPPDTGDDDTTEGDDDTGAGGDDDTTEGDDDTEEGDDDDTREGDDDIVADPCAFIAGRITELTGGCTSDCADPLVTLTGTCEVQIGEPPLISNVEIIEATYAVDVNEGSGFLLDGGAVRIIDDGYQLDTVYGDFVVGVTGTEYEARINENNKLTITVNEGAVDVYYRGDKIATLEAAPDIAAVMTFDTETGTIIEPPVEDPCEENPAECATDPCETDPANCPPDKPKPQPEGCSSGCNTTPPATASLWAFMLTAIAATRRKLQGISK